MIVCLDTSVLIRFVSHYEDEQVKKRQALAWLQEALDRKDLIMIPSLVYNEFMSIANEGRYQEQVGLMKSIAHSSVPFDRRCADLASKVWREMAKHQTMKYGGTEKRIVQSDIQIAATAAANGAEVLMTLDADFSGKPANQGIGQALRHLGHNLITMEPYPNQPIIPIKNI